MTQSDFNKINFQLKSLFVCWFERANLWNFQSDLIKSIFAWNSPVLEVKQRGKKLPFYTADENKITNKVIYINHLIYTYWYTHGCAEGVTRWGVCPPLDFENTIRFVICKEKTFYLMYFWSLILLCTHW